MTEICWKSLLNQGKTVTERFSWLSVKSNPKLLWFCFTTLCDWLKKRLATWSHSFSRACCWLCVSAWVLIGYLCCFHLWLNTHRILTTLCQSFNLAAISIHTPAFFITLFVSYSALAGQIKTIVVTGWSVNSRDWSSFSSHKHIWQIFAQFAVAWWWLYKI